MIDVERLRSKVKFCLLGVPDFMSEDVEQDIWLAIVRAEARFNPSRGVLFSSFITKRIRGIVLDQLRVIDTVALEYVHDTVASNKNSPETDAINCHEVNRFLSRLGSAERHVVVEYFVKQRTLREIGIDIGLSEGRICQIKNGALRRMRAGN